MKSTAFRFGNWEGKELMVGTDTESRTSESIRQEASKTNVLRRISEHKRSV